ncbi:hypothetical protein LLE49_06565 [Alicyclobacillus tolerans]|uniref:hypothetical protein n=1 Tax=Alicyclobacillus tolerans TaxID=90970 RepID=UPI001F3091C1|nr:hypothetical protein [Alicyclobacillus tolerans]MCF8564407.1 hypothetical protein [Alicyclobacillus tolerans]
MLEGRGIHTSNEHNAHDATRSDKRLRPEEQKTHARVRVGSAVLPPVQTEPEKASKTFSGRGETGGRAYGEN